MWIQIILILAIVAIGFIFMRRSGSDRHLAIQRLLLGAFILVAVLSVLFPGWLSWLARLVGVGRGTDLLLYAFVIVFAAFVVTQRRRAVAQDAKITQLAQRIALLEASMDPGPAVVSDSSDEDQSQAVIRHNEAEPSRSTSSNPG